MMSLLAIALVVISVALAPAAGFAQEPQTSLPDIEDEVMCPICGVPLELAIDAPQAQQQRALIRELVAEGRTKDEIKDALVAEYGEQVLAVPEAEGFDLAAWLVPGAAIVIAGGAIVLGLRRWRRDGGQGGSSEPDTESRLDPEDDQRLDADLARYKL